MQSVASSPAGCRGHQAAHEKPGLTSIDAKCAHPVKNDDENRWNNGIHGQFSETWKQEGERSSEQALPLYDSNNEPPRELVLHAEAIKNTLTQSSLRRSRMTGCTCCFVAPS